MSCTGNAKVSDSGYTNTCDNSRSQRSSGSLLSRNSNIRSDESSGYYGGNPSCSFGSSDKALPQSVNKASEEYKKKKAKTTAKLGVDTESALKGAGQEMDVGLVSIIPNMMDQMTLKKSGTVELTDAMDQGDHASYTDFPTPEGDLDTHMNPLDIISPNVNAEFYVVVSLCNGLVLHTSASLQTVLGYPKDAWIGHSFIDFIKVQDQATFTNKLTNNIAWRFSDHHKDLAEPKTTLFCNLQRYLDPALSIQTSQTEKPQVPLSFSPFHLSLGFKQFRKLGNDDEPNMMFLTIKAQAVFSAYKAPEETILSSIFSTRHSASCHISYVDDEAVQYLGYLPQNMIGCSILKFYHPEDMTYIKDIYETVVRLKGSTLRSEPYRFAVQNGGYVILETDWSSFINPWEKKLDLVIGHHRVLRGPANPDVFQLPNHDLQNSLVNISEEVLKESKIIQDEILSLLAQKITITMVVKSHELIDQSKDIKSFMKTLVHGAKHSNLTSRIPEIMVPEDGSLSEHDSVIFGDVSPHHEYCDSKSSTETPPSYNQLNYNEKLERFFNSKPLLTSVYSQENVNFSSSSQDDASKPSLNLTPSNHMTTNHDSGSNENLSSGSNNQPSSLRKNDVDKSNQMVIDNVQVPILTEVLLNKHNHDMEKLMVQKHKERRSTTKNNGNRDLRVKLRNQKVPMKQEKLQTNSRAWKRSKSRSKEGENIKKFKLETTGKNYDQDNNITTKIDENINVGNLAIIHSTTIINMWPQIAVTTSILPKSQDLSGYTIYVPSISHVRIPSINSSSAQILSQFPSLPVQQVSDNSYTPTSAPGATHPLSAVPSPMVVDMPTVPSESAQKSTVTPVRRRTPSQDVSRSAPTGSLMAISESSKKVLSPGGHFSSCVSINGGCSSDRQAMIENSQRIGQNESSFEDSSDSSFYGSFLSTSSGSTNYNFNLMRNESRSCKDETTERRRFGMINELKVNYELQKVREASFPPLNLTPPKYDGSTQGMGPAGPPWGNVKMTPELIYRYQMTPKVLSDVLKADLEALNNLTQPQLVNDQLEQLYLDLELEGFTTKLSLEDSNLSSDSDRADSDAEQKLSPRCKQIRREIKHSKLAMIYEENAPVLMSY